MDIYFLYKIFLISLFSFIQSVLGVGLLVFGTPTFLIMGESFEKTLILLLPSSLLISSFQFLSSRHSQHESLKELSYYAIPSLVVGLSLILFFGFKINLKLLVSCMLIFTGILRVFPSLLDIFLRIIKKHKKIYLIIMGLIHGVSNLGGGLLTIYASSLGNNKTSIRGIISFGYIVFAISQLTLLLISSHQLFSWEILLYLSISFIIYRFLGRKLFDKIPDKIFNRLMTILIFSYGVLLLSF